MSRKKYVFKTMVESTKNESMECDYEIIGIVPYNAICVSMEGENNRRFYELEFPINCPWALVQYGHNLIDGSCWIHFTYNDGTAIQSSFSMNHIDDKSTASAFIKSWIGGNLSGFALEDMSLIMGIIDANKYNYFSRLEDPHTMVL